MSYRVVPDDAPDPGEEHPAQAGALEVGFAVPREAAQAVGAQEHGD